MQTSQAAPDAGTELVSDLKNVPEWVRVVAALSISWADSLGVLDHLSFL
jgi:hypothetical protein